MAKRYAVLQKKLEELELDLNNVIALPDDIPCHQLLSEGINGRFGFLKSLLSAEIKSQPEKPHHLHHIAHRLDELEAVFQDWDNFRTSPDNHLDTASTCSCTESCLNDDGDGSPDLGITLYQDPESILNGVNQEKPLVVVDKVEGCMERENWRRVWIGKNGNAAVMMTTVVVMFAGVVMASLCGYCYYKREMEGFLPPT